MCIAGKNDTICIINNKMYNNSLLCIIDTLYKKIQELNISLWMTEQKCIEMEKQIAMQKNELEYYKECIKHRDDEIKDMNYVLDHVSNSSNYFALQREKEEIDKNYNILLKTFCDIEYRL